MAKQTKEFSIIMPSDDHGAFTALDMLAAAGAELNDEMISLWGISVWETFSATL
jgi:hypothetical protein